jgi:hypothetical protein
LFPIAFASANPAEHCKAETLVEGALLSSAQDQSAFQRSTWDFRYQLQGLILLSDPTTLCSPLRIREQDGDKQHGSLPWPKRQSLIEMMSQSGGLFSHVCVCTQGIGDKEIRSRMSDNAESGRDSEAVGHGRLQAEGGAV